MGLGAGRQETTGAVLHLPAVFHKPPGRCLDSIATSCLRGPPPGMSPDLITFQAYLAGRLTAHVLRGIPGAITRQSFLDELYNTRLRPDCNVGTIRLLRMWLGGGVLAADVGK